MTHFEISCYMNEDSSHDRGVSSTQTN